MRAITLWQPWATFCVEGIKQYETRSWGTSYRGLLAIHAAKRPFDLGYLPMITGKSNGELDYEKLKKLDYPLGKIIGVVNLTRVFKMVNEIENDFDNLNIACVTAQEQVVGDWQPGRFAWQLKDPKKFLEPIEHRGTQGLRKVDPELEWLIKNAR
jgi:activating signal cointegrator 1